MGPHDLSHILLACGGSSASAGSALQRFESLTPWAWKDRNSSLKSGNIRQSFFHGVNSTREFGNRLHPLMDRATPPVAILVRFHVGMVVVDVDRLIHDSFLALGGTAFNRLTAADRDSLYPIPCL